MAPLQPERPALPLKLYLAFVVQGGANLVPWQVFIALVDYFQYTYRSNSVEFYFPAISTSVLVLTAALMALVGQRLSFRARIFWPSVVLVCFSTAVPIISLLLAAELITPGRALELTLLAVPVNAFCSATAQNALFGLGALIGDGATGALQVGNGLTGVLSVLLRAVSKMGVRPVVSMWSFCTLSAAVLVAACVSYHTTIAPALAHVMSRRKSSWSSGAEGGVPGQGRGAPLSPEYYEALLAEDGPSRARCASNVWRESLCVFVVFAVALSCFPGLSTSLTSTTWGLGSWYPLVLVGCFNVGDLLGKSLPARVRLVGRRALPWWTLLHGGYVLVFLVLLRPALLPPPLQGDALPVLVVLSFGASTGYLGCTCLLLAAEAETSRGARERAGVISSFALMVGLSVGSASGLLISKTVAASS